MRRYELHKIPTSITRIVAKKLSLFSLGTSSQRTKQLNPKRHTDKRTDRQTDRQTDRHKRQKTENAKYAKQKNPKAMKMHDFATT